MVHEDYKEMLPARALSALDTSENSALNEHLLVCPECRRDLENWEATSSALALSTTPLEPTPALRDRIIGQVREERSSQTVADPGSRVVPFVAPARNIRSTFASFGLIAAGIVLTLLIGWIVLLWRENRLAKLEVARLTEEIKTTGQRLAVEQEIVTLLTAPGTRMSGLSATNAAPGASALLAYDTHGEALLIAHGLPAAPVGKNYQLWFIVGNKPMPGKVFNTDNSGSGVLRERVPADAMEKSVFAITLEPSPGVSEPTGAILLRSEL